MYNASVHCSCTMKRSWTYLTEPEIQRAGAGSPTLRSTRTPVAASTPLESRPDWCSQRRRSVHVCVLVFVTYVRHLQSSSLHFIVSLFQYVVFLYIIYSKAVTLQLMFPGLKVIKVYKTINVSKLFNLLHCCGLVWIMFDALMKFESSYFKCLQIFLINSHYSS